MQVKIGHRIRELRKASQPSWTINRLAVATQIDPAQLSRAERGLAGLSLDALDRVAAQLGVSLATLVDPDGCRNCKLAGAHEELIRDVTESIWLRLSDEQLAKCSQAEQDLIRHQVRSSIEEGVRRSQIQAEREIELILSK